MFESSTRKLFFLCLTTAACLITARDPRGNEHLERCVGMAEPLVQNSEFIFPLTLQEIRSVCRMWDEFQDCVNEYTATYLSPSEKEEFNTAIHSAIDSIRQLCAEEPDYQKSYMAYAPCAKRVSTGPSFCGGQYKYLADLVQGTTATDAQICCAHYKFRDCVLDKIPDECDGDTVAAGSSLPPSRFMRHMLDRALGFLLQSCRDFVPNARDCPKTNLGNSGSPTTTANNHNHNHHNDFNNHHNDNSIGNNQYLRPDSTTSRISTTSPRSTTRFTWTTKFSGSVTPRPTSHAHLAGNGLPEPASQQYRGGAAGFVPGIMLMATALATVLRIC